MGEVPLYGGWWFGNSCRGTSLTRSPPPPAVVLEGSANPLQGYLAHKKLPLP